MLFHQKRIMLRETLRVPKASTVERVTDYDDGAGDDAMYSVCALRVVRLPIPGD